MKDQRARRREFSMRIWSILSGAAFLGALATSGAAQAHPKLLSTSPSINASVRQLNKIQLRFSENLVGAMTSGEVDMIGMPGNIHHRPVKMNGFRSILEADGKTLTIARARPLPPGNYRVLWHAVSVDTHRVGGSFGLRVK
jgi:methionine-rich copper-binding protein CopC